MNNITAKQVSTEHLEVTLQNAVDLTSQGLNQKEIADELDIHKSSVSKHLKNARNKGELKQNILEDY